MQMLLPNGSRWATPTQIKYVLFQGVEIRFYVVYLKRKDLVLLIVVLSNTQGTPVFELST